MSYKEVLEALDRIKPYIHRTPVFTCSYIDQLVGRQVFFKCENFQKTGSFKVRGALNASLKIKEKNPSSPGVAVQSSGNMAQGLAYAAEKAGLKCSVVLPENSPQSKKDAIEGYGPNIYVCKQSYTIRVETCQRVAKENGGQEIISSFDNLDVINGQGTIAVEFLEEVPDLDAMLMSISGGGMGAGVSLAAKAIRPQCRVYAVEPDGKDLGPSLKAGKRLWPEPPVFMTTIADGIRLQAVGKKAFPIFLENMEKDVFTIDDSEIVEAMKLVWHRMKMVIEPSAAICVAAALSEQMKQLPDSIKKIGIILCGGNVDIERLPWEQKH